MDASHVPPAKCGSYPVRKGNLVASFIDGVPFYSELLRAIEGGHRSVFAAISFFHRDFCFPTAGGREHFFTVLNRAAERGVEVRLLFWKHSSNNQLFANNLNGCESQRKWLEDRAHPSILIRWHSSGPNRHHCHHEKSWLVDAGTPEQIGYTGGIIVANSWVVEPGHGGNCHDKHDVMVGMQGPVCTDLHHNFVQRWNSALVGEDPEVVCFPSAEQCDDLQFPTELFPLRAAIEERLCHAQLQRSICESNCWVPAPVVDGPDFDVSGGEASILEQYEKAIDNAIEVIYLENQHIAHASLLGKLEEALQRGVQVVYVVPGYVLHDRLGSKTGTLVRPLFAYGHYVCQVAMRSFHTMYRRFWKTIPDDNGAHPHHSHDNSYAEPFLEILPRLGSYENFCVAGMAVSPRSEGGAYRDVYVHSKLMIVDDSFMTCGSANLVDLSMEKNHTEVNLSLWSTAIASSTREAIWRELLGTDECDGLSPQEAFKQFVDIAKQNAEQVQQRKPLSQGLAHALRASEYGLLLYGLSIALEAKSCA